jgi:chlorite dismutase
MSNVAARPQAEAQRPSTGLRRQYVNFAVYQVAPEWRRLPEQERQAGKDEFAAVIKEFTDSKKAQILSYTTMGIRADADMILWIICYELDVIQQLATALAKTGLGSYSKRTYSFLSMTKRSMYMDRFNPEHQEDRVHLIPGKHKYFFIYPFVKKREWYLLPMADRQAAMDEHIKTGQKYPSVKLNTTYSFGLDDQDFVVAFETDEPGDFLDLVQELRESQASLYTVRDTPLMTCIHKELNEVLDDLG